MNQKIQNTKKYRKNQTNTQKYLNTQKTQIFTQILLDEPKISKVLYEYPKYIFKILKFYLKLETITENVYPELKNICNTENISKIPKYT